jgi:predicted DNA-binding transcriptional regulator AlpA
METTEKLLRHPQLAPYFPDGRAPHPSTLNRWERAGKFPKPLRVGERWKAWRASDIEVMF